MEDLFRQFWWLIFPLSWFVFGGYQSWLSYRANRDTLDLIKTYAQAGREPPPELLAKLSKRWNDGDDLDEETTRRAPASPPPLSRHAPGTAWRCSAASAPASPTRRSPISMAG
jgi:hypothetical protein